MSHLLILCEGHTEQQVLKPFLKIFYEQRFSFVDVRRYDGKDDLARSFKQDAELQLTQEKDSSVLCLVDVYEDPFGIHKLYKKGTITLEECYQRIQQQLTRQINSQYHARFGAFPVVMELETWALADPNVQTSLGATFLAPETEPHPAQTLNNLYKKRNSNYRKVLNGVALFNKANAQRVYDDNCPHFKQLADWLTAPSTPDVSSTYSEEIKQKLSAWEAERDRRYQRFLGLEQVILTNADLDAAVAAETQYREHLSTYDQIFSV